MTALIVLGCILLFFIFLLSIKVKIIISYSDEIALTVRILGLKIKILPAKSKKGPHSMSEKKAAKIKKKLRAKKLKKNEAARKKAAKKEEEKQNKTQKPKKTLPEILYIIDLVRTLAAKVIKTFFKHLRIDITKLKIVVATGDAATTAIAYGAITQSINLLFPILEEIKNFSLPKDTDIDVSVDYLSEGITADIRLGFALRVWHVFAVAFGALFKLIGYLIKNPRPQKKNSSENHKVSTKK
jgi:hypothetical protein